MSRPPHLFVSSTCYDLRQVRADISDFARSFGLEPVLSEYESFPVDPSLDTIENCMQAVEQKADLFVLIVGTRYGHVAMNGKSVTNMEYTKARARGIPVYVFIHRSIIDMLPIWKANHSIFTMVSRWLSVLAFRPQEH